MESSEPQVVGHLISGRRIEGGTATAEVFDPATGAVAAFVCLADAATVAGAVASAKAAFPAWSGTTPLKRARILDAVKRALEANASRICEAITREHGKVLADSMGELQRGIENLEYATYAPELLKGEHSRGVGGGINAWCEHRPLGVTAGITPFNFPAMVPLWMWPMALACGNTFVLKPSERDPSSALMIAELALEAGLPPGVLNVVNGGKEAVDALLASPDVKAISFVGSTPVAEHVYAAASRHGKRVQALGGAKNHAVVMPDALMDNAISALMGAAFGSGGERCMAVSVVVAVGEATADALVAGLAREIQSMTVGAGGDARSEMGPLVTRAHRDRVASYVDIGVGEGAKLVVDGRRLRVAGGENGYFLGPCLFDHVTAGMRVCRDEIFGPVLCVVRAASLDEAIAIVNAHEFGNGTCIFTQDGEAARRFTDAIEVGMVGVNVPLPVPVAYHSFGGWKRSLFGDLHAYGPDAVRFYTRRKAVTERWLPSTTREGAVFSFPASR